MRRSLYIFALLLSLSCEHITESNTTLYCIGFTAGREGKSVTPLSKAPFTQGSVASVIIFPSGALTGFRGGTPIYATAADGGVLQYNDGVYLTRGVYDIYSISYNSVSLPSIVFNNGLSAHPENFIEYLWASRKEVVVDGDKVIDFHYKRLSCRVILRVIPDSSYNNITVNSISFTLPTVSNSSINLSDGTITPALTAGNLSQIEGSGDTRSFIIVPSQTTHRVETVISGEINGEQLNNKRFGCELNINFEPGNSYSIEMEIIGNKEVILTYHITPWRVVDNIITYSRIIH